MNTESELSRLKLYYEDLHEPSLWRMLRQRVKFQDIREHAAKKMATIALPAWIKRGQR